MITSCQERPTAIDGSIRPQADTVGFVQYAWQMDSIMQRINRLQSAALNGIREYPDLRDVDSWRVCISPHDDYAYVGFLYPALLERIRARTVILVGVAHKARLLNLEDQIVFDSYDYWRGPYGPMRVSSMRKELLEMLPSGIFQVNDSMQRIEHSLEAIVPFLQYYRRDVEILPILVPCMSFERMKFIAGQLADALHRITTEKKMSWGRDFAMIISSDAVHYGDEGWGGNNFARYGADSTGYLQALAHEQEIMAILSGMLSEEGILAFNSFTLKEDDYREYRWTWCGRYSIPLGLLAALDLQHLERGTPLSGIQVGYGTSIGQPALPVGDLGMGTTAPATIRHWVGYAAIGYR
ncbi:MAG: AmmeMemoRadiSam system protein B [Bacteroidales bacterium]|nr:AmmeMemoRadiSam system protein B [Bacteroidales bacterium]